MSASCSYIYAYYYKIFLLVLLEKWDVAVLYSKRRSLYVGIRSTLEVRLRPTSYTLSHRLIQCWSLHWKYVCPNSANFYLTVTAAFLLCVNCQLTHWLINHWHFSIEVRMYHSLPNIASVTKEALYNMDTSKKYRADGQWLNCRVPHYPRIKILCSSSGVIFP